MASDAGRPWALDEESADPILRQAVELGITFWDTANVYCAGSSEEFVGRAVRRYTRRQSVVLAAKIHGGASLPTLVAKELDSCAISKSLQEPTFAFEKGQPTSGFEPLTRCLQIRQQLDSARDFGFPCIHNASIESQRVLQVGYRIGYSKSSPGRGASRGREPAVPSSDLQEQRGWLKGWAAMA